MDIAIVGFPFDTTTCEEQTSFLHFGPASKSDALSSYALSCQAWRPVRSAWHSIWQLEGQAWAYLQCPLWSGLG